MRTSRLPRTAKGLAAISLAGFIVLLTSPRGHCAVLVNDLHLFGVFTNGANPAQGLVQAGDGSFYGATPNGGASGWGTVFKLTPDGSVTSLHSFTGPDGANPSGSLALGTDGYFYGLTCSGGASNAGVIFRINSVGAFTNLYSFSGGNDGQHPSGPLFQASDGNFYGTTLNGGTNGNGTIFKISPAAAFTTLHSFTQKEGAQPNAPLTQAPDGFLYGTANAGGISNCGTIFKIATNGACSNLYSFTNGYDASNPVQGLATAGAGYFCGAAYSGGENNFGAIFKFTTNGALTILHSFLSPDGQSPSTPLTPTPDGSLFGATEAGGAGFGTIFKITPTGTFTTLYNFTGASDGNIPRGSLILAQDGSLYSTTQAGGSNGLGVIFKITPAGTFSPIYSFPGGSDGEYPVAALTPATDGYLYGTTSYGGLNGLGTVFKIAPAGAFASVYSFAGTNDGRYPVAALTPARDGALYGTTSGGGTDSQGWGTVFKVTTAGTFKSLYSFSGGNDGGYPYANLVQASDGNLYGTTYTGGSNGWGTVFKITTAGAFTNLYSFTGGNDGQNPASGLVDGGNGNLFGTVEYGGANGAGAIFEISTTGKFTSLYSFTGESDGANPSGSLARGKDGSLFGMTSTGGASGLGTVFAASPAGAFQSLYSFSGPDGMSPQGSLALGNDGNFYGTTSGGGANGFGVIFKITPGGSFTLLYSFNGSTDGRYPAAGLALANDGNFYATTELGPQGVFGAVFRMSQGSSVPVLQSPTFNAGAVNITWSADAGATYQLQYNSDGSTHWTNLGPSATASGPSMNFLDAATNAQARFYRVLVPR